ncbi:hypothetical protein [Luteibacter yeojuensis]|uniref:hypothetical protein n=1 Tax=Luteibacter yeojuensis TaxID=345309 RepID=UPI0012EE6999|nr:hypothetical protein [Luteibacter yeojuensis]
MKTSYHSIIRNAEKPLKYWMKVAAFVALSILLVSTGAIRLETSEDIINDAAHLASVSVMGDYLESLERIWEKRNRDCGAPGELSTGSYAESAQRIAESFEEASEELERESPYQVCAIAARDVALQMANCKGKRSVEISKRLKGLWEIDKRRCLLEIKFADPR